MISVDLIIFGSILSGTKSMLMARDNMVKVVLSVTVRIRGLQWLQQIAAEKQCRGARGSKKLFVENLCEVF